jgi:alkaline phosphatase D
MIQPFTSDHDYGRNNVGEEYECRNVTQNEFVNHFNIPSFDPRHPAQGENQQQGVYSAYVFHKPATSDVGIHLINMDVRYHRSITLAEDGPCDGASSTFLGDTQWRWLEAELSKDSDLKIVASGTQVLPPTNRDHRKLNAYCAYDGVGGTFDDANTALNEGVTTGSGSRWDSWAQIPQERTRLLHLCQESINAGHTKKIIFICA